MHSTTSVLLFAILAPLALAAPTQKRSVSKRSFVVPRNRNPTYVRDGATALKHAYHKHGWTSPLDGPTTTISGDGWNITFPDVFGSGSDDGSDDGSAATSSASSFATSIVYSAPASTYSAASSTYVAASTTSAASAAASATGASVSASSSNTTSPDSKADGQTGTTIASSAEGGAEYLCPVTIGGQTLNLDFDTGSSDLWVFSTELPSADVGSHTAFDSSKSSTFKTLSGYTWKITYGDDSGASGNVGTDTVEVGSATVTSQAVELATAVSSQFVADTSSDGLLGLGFKNINQVSPTAQNTFFGNIMADLEQPVFTADLTEDGSGSYEFGTIDSSKYTGEISYTDIDSSNGWWQFTSDSYSIGGVVTQNSGASPAIVDTGTSLLLVDTAVATAYWGQVSGATLSSSQGGYIFPCSATLPDFAVAIGSSYMAKVPGTALNYGTASGDQCFGGLQGSDQGVQIYGDVLITQSFIVFDGGNNQIGFATKA